MQSSTRIRRCIGIESAYISAGTKCAKQPLQTGSLPPMVVASPRIRYRQSSFIHHPSRAIRSIGGCNHNTGSTLSRSHPAASAISHFSRNLLCPGNANENTDIVVANVSSSQFSTTTTDNNTPAANTTKPQYQYIHPLSQIVLEHLQSRHTSWVQKVGLDEGLRLNEDGTFVLRFPGEADADGEGGGEGGDDDDDNDGDESSSAVGTNGSIWTMYEPEEKKHYLCVTKGNLVGRYMLQDNTKPAWHSDRRSTPERVQDAVDEMICKLEETGN